MQEPRYIEVDINPDGTTSIEAIGFHGTGCKAMTEAFGDALGQTLDEGVKPEYSENQANRNTVCNSN